MSSNVKPLVALSLTAVGTVLVANFQVSEPAITVADVSTDATPSTAPTTTTTQPAATPSTTTSTGSATSGTTTSSTTARVGATATPTPAPTETSTMTTSGSGTTYADGTYAGAAVSEPWGTFEVQVTISSGQITDVQLVAAPRDRHSSSINSQAVPILTEEAISAQSANIDMLSGATWTSQSYITSLQAALDGALAAEQSVAG